MEKLNSGKRLLIAKYYLNGLSYDKIGVKTGVSKGTVANVITELKSGYFPEIGDVGENIDLLRELSLELKQARLTPGECALGLAALKQINECGLDPGDINQWPVILKAAGNADQIRNLSHWFTVSRRSCGEPA